MTDALRSTVLGGVAGVVLSGLCGVAGADVVSDQAAAFVVWPDVVALNDGDGNETLIDTVIQLSNTSTEPVLAHCFYENANHHCSNSGQVCLFATDCCDPSTGCGSCVAGWLETDFRVRLTPRQPIGWVVTAGLTGRDFPLTGAGGSTAPDGSSNAGSNIPPVSEVPYNGVLRCIAINDDGTPSDRNVLKGESTRLSARSPGVSVAKHNAVGLRAIVGAVNDDRELVFGGGEAEYEGCPEVVIVDHLFDGVRHPALAELEVGDQMTTSGFGVELLDGGVATRLTLVPCTQDYRRQISGSSVVQYLVYNEFEQRFSTSRSVDCKFEGLLSTIDTSDPQRSIFSAGVGGSVVGQTRLRGIGSGLLGVASEITYGRSNRAGLSGGLNAPGSKTVRANPVFGALYFLGGDVSDFQLHQQGDRAEADVVTLP